MRRTSGFARVHHGLAKTYVSDTVLKQDGFVFQIVTAARRPVLARSVHIALRRRNLSRKHVVDKLKSVAYAADDHVCVLHRHFAALRKAESDPTFCHSSNLEVYGIKLSVTIGIYETPLEIVHGREVLRVYGHRIRIGEIAKGDLRDD